MSKATTDRESSERKEPARDRPLCFHWKAVDDDWIRSHNLPPPRNRKYAEARASVLLEALIANRVAPAQWISYSRRKEWWSSGTRYRGSSYTYATVPAAVEELAALGLLEHDRKPPGNLGWQSRFRATPKLLQAIRIPTVIYDSYELIQLKDHEGELIDYRDTNNTISMRRRIEEFNEALSAADLQLRGPGVENDGVLLRAGDDHLLYPAMRVSIEYSTAAPFRMAAGSMEVGGSRSRKKFDRICSLTASPLSSTTIPSCIPICFMRKLEHVSTAMHTLSTVGLATS